MYEFILSFRPTAILFFPFVSFLSIFVEFSKISSFKLFFCIFQINLK